ncbi:unnamed protein product [Medioppia subpectinata]|uniref:GT23 domain-containing protein n=1 Tax=Medioppia subpectinata TaxID=1979941 RepID=A0A7R9KGK2_9ACAR|nr:unnamed protein product [Medioppia subpectinata]CAG2102887.1 unnamed protein product [Medioppia subpectinata]
MKSRMLFVLVSLSWLLLIFFLLNVSSVQRLPEETNTVQVDNRYAKLNDRLNEANRQIELLMEQNKHLAQNLKTLTDLKVNPQELSVERPEAVKVKDALALNAFPGTPFETSLRRVRQNVDEIWHYLRTKMDKKSMGFVNDLRYNMFYELDVLSDRDNRWRNQELKNLSDFVQNRIHRLQNPSDCENAKKLVCDLNKYCGFGCQIHHLAHCFVAALALNRTLICDTQDWRSSSGEQNVWNKLFQPISQTCVNPNGHNRTDWGDDKRLHSYQVMYYPIIDYITPLPEFLPLVIPQQIADPLIRQSGEPFIWFIGNVLKYMLRPSDQLSQFMDTFKRDNQFSHPIVGIHVRRTDKIGTEAKFHTIDEYMFYVEDFYNKLDLKSVRQSANKKAQRLVYLATDEPNVWLKEIKPYQERGYVFKGDIKLSQSADPSQRQEFESLHDVVVDLLLLSQCDYIVCTFSSQICRMAFELMQTRHSSTQDMSQAFYSLDDIYYFGGQVFHGKKAIVSHSAQSKREISFNAGDILGIERNEHNGYNTGDHNRTKRKGLYPRFKVTEFVESKPFAAFH